MYLCHTPLPTVRECMEEEVEEVEEEEEEEEEHGNRRRREVVLRSCYRRVLLS